MSIRRQQRFAGWLRHALAGAGLAIAPQVVTAAIFDVTRDTWGTSTDVGSFAWAVEQANTQAGADTINIASGLEIDVDATAQSSLDSWLARFTESVAIQGNGAKLVGNPTYVTSGGLVATKTNIVGSAYSPAIVATDTIVTPAISFAQIGTAGADNSSISVSFTDLGMDGLASVAQANQGSRLTVTGGSFTNLVNYTGVNAVGRSAFEAGTGSTLHLSEVSISRHFPFDSVVDVSADASIFFGTVAGQDADLNVESSSISDSFGAGALAWNGGTANIVSSVISNAGGLSIGDDATDGVLNFVNSILYMTGGDDLSQTNRIQAISDGEANIAAASILYDALSTSASCIGIAYECNGMPLTATLGGILNFNASVAVPLNADFAYPGKDSYSELAGGDLRADRYAYVGATAAQDEAALRALFDMLLLETDGDTFDLIDFGVFQEFMPLPGGAYPLSGGVLAGVIPDAGIGGVNALINPIDGQPLLFDVFGNPRTDARGYRDIGAVQAAPEPQALPLAGLLAFLLHRVSRQRRHRQG